MKVWSVVWMHGGFERIHQKVGGRVPSGISRNKEFGAVGTSHDAATHVSLVDTLGNTLLSVECRIKYNVTGRQTDARCYSCPKLL